jgi:hypothetical protein
METEASGQPKGQTVQKNQGNPVQETSSSQTTGSSLHGIESSAAGMD